MKKSISYKKNQVIDIFFEWRVIYPPFLLAENNGEESLMNLTCKKKKSALYED